MTPYLKEGYQLSMSKLQMREMFTFESKRAILSCGIETCQSENYVLSYGSDLHQGILSIIYLYNKST